MTTQTNPTVTSLTFDSIEEVKAFLVSTGMREADLAKALEALEGDEEDTEPCDCAGCLYDELMEATGAKSKEINLAVEAGTMTELQGLLELAPLLTELKAATEAKEVADKEEESEARTDELVVITHSVVAELAKMGINPTGNARTGMLVSTAKTIQALDKLGLLK